MTHTWKLLKHLHFPDQLFPYPAGKKEQSNLALSMSIFPQFPPNVAEFDEWPFQVVDQCHPSSCQTSKNVLMCIRLKNVYNIVVHIHQKQCIYVVYQWINEQKPLKTLCCLFLVSPISSVSVVLQWLLKNLKIRTSMDQCPSKPSDSGVTVICWDCWTYHAYKSILKKQHCPQQIMGIGSGLGLF